MKRHSKHYINFFIDIIVTISVMITLGSSLILWVILQRGIGTHGDQYCQKNGLGLQGNFNTVLEWPRYVWIDIHVWASIVLLAIIVIHLLVHWRWIVESIKRVKSFFIGHIKKITEQFITAVILFVLFMADCFTGFIIWIILPRGSYDYYMMLNGLGRTFGGLQRNIWLDIHGWIAVTMLSIVIIHLILNLNWTVNITKKFLHILSSPFIQK